MGEYYDHERYVIYDKINELYDQRAIMIGYDASKCRYFDHISIATFVMVAIYATISHYNTMQSVMISNLLSTIIAIFTFTC